MREETHGKNDPCQTLRDKLHVNGGFLKSCRDRGKDIEKAWDVYTKHTSILGGRSLVLTVGPLVYKRCQCLHSFIATDTIKKGCYM